MREACRAAEERYGLRRTAPWRPDRRPVPDPRRAREGPAPQSARAAPRGAAADGRHRGRGAASEDQFFGRLADAGVLVRKRFSTRTPGEVTGYSVALPDDVNTSGSPVWFSGGKLAPDLTLPKLRHRWDPAHATPARGFTTAERDAMWSHATRSAAEAASQIRFYSAADPNAAADAAWAAADTLHVAAAALGSRVLRQAADSFERAARAPYGRLPRPAPAGSRSAAGRPAAGRRWSDQQRARDQLPQAHFPARRAGPGTGRDADGPATRRAGRSRAAGGRVPACHAVGEGAPCTRRASQDPDGRRAGQPGISVPCRHAAAIPGASLRRGWPGGLSRTWRGPAAGSHPIAQRGLLPRRFRCSGRGRPCAPGRLALGFPRLRWLPGSVEAQDRWHARALSRRTLGRAPTWSAFAAC